MDTVQNKSGETFKVTGNWETQSKQLKAKYVQLTDGDLKFEPGKDHELLGRIGTRLDKKHEEVIGIIEKIQSEIA